MSGATRCWRAQFHEVRTSARKVRTLHTNNQVNPAVRWLRKGSSIFVLFFKASMVGFTFYYSRALLLYYLRRRSPGPPFPPDHRPSAVSAQRSGRGTAGYFTSA